MKNQNDLRAETAAATTSERTINMHSTNMNHHHSKKVATFFGRLAEAAGMSRWLGAMVVATLAFMAPTTSRAAHVGTVTVGAPTGNPVDVGGSATYVVTIVRGTGGGSSGPFIVAMSLTTSLPTGASFSFSPSTVSFSSADTSKTTTLTISTTCSTPTANNASFTVKGLDALQSSYATNNGTITINADTTLPNFVGFPANIGPVNMDFNACGATISWTAPTATDNCGTPTLVQTAGLTSGNLFPAGTTTITYQATDTAGNVTNKSFTVTVNADKQNPTVTATTAITANTDAGHCYASVAVTNAAFGDNCAGSSLAYVLTGATTGSGSGQVGTATFNKGVTTITYTVTDASANFATATATVTVNDTENPTLIAGHIAAGYDTIAHAEAAAIAATTISDNCDLRANINVSASTAGASCAVVITVTAQDTAGNSDSTTYNTYIDNTAPVIGTITAVQGSSNVKNCANTALQGVVNISVVANDNCGLTGNPVVTMANGSNTDAATFDHADLGSGTYYYTWSVPACAANGTWTVNVAASDTVQTTNSSFTICVNKTQITGQLQLDRFVGATRDVVFVATTNWGVTNYTVLKTWTNTLSFSGSHPTGGGDVVGGTATYTLTGVPTGANGLSAKTAWNLRRKLSLTVDGCSQAVADFTGDNQLNGGDMNGDNCVRLSDYLILGDNWLSFNPVADLNGNSQVDFYDYMILYLNYYTTGDPQ